MRSHHHRFPTITASLSALALAAWWIPGAREALQLDRMALAHGELWRLFTGHLTHWTASHLAWDIAAFALLGALVERRSRRLLVTTLGASTLAISTAVLFLQAGLPTYRGLSGVDSALFAAAVVGMTSDGLARRDWRSALLAAVAAAGFVAKTGVELASSSTLFVAGDVSFLPVPLAHLVGALAGAASALAPTARRKGPGKTVGRENGANCPRASCV